MAGQAGYAREGGRSMTRPQGRSRLLGQFLGLWEALWRRDQPHVW